MSAQICRNDDGEPITAAVDSLPFGTYARFTGVDLDGKPVTVDGLLVMAPVESPAGWTVMVRQMPAEVDVLVRTGLDEDVQFLDVATLDEATVTAIATGTPYPKRAREVVVTWWVAHPRLPNDGFWDQETRTDVGPDELANLMAGVDGRILAAVRW